MTSERQLIQGLFKKLCGEPKHSFPQPRESLNAPKKPGAYIIRKDRIVLHVGRTVRGKEGLRQRLNNHLHGSSSFTEKYLKGKGSRLRKKGYTYQCLTEKDDRRRALLEAYAVGTLCPKHVGLGE